MLFKKLRQAFTGYYNFLLLFLTLLFIFRPHSHNVTHLAIWQLLLSVVLLSAIFNAHHNRAVKITITALAVPTILFCWLTLLHPSTIVFVGNTCLLILFLGICSTSIIYDVIVRSQVTLETLRGVVCAYFMVAFLFAYIYYLTEFLVPESFYLIHRETGAFSYAEYLAELLYFSFVTLLTVGFGDITPTQNAAQTAVVIEGIIGQFYVAILVARIVAVYVFSSDKRLLHTIEEDMGIRKKPRKH